MLDRLASMGSPKRRSTIGSPRQGLADSLPLSPDGIAHDNHDVTAQRTVRPDDLRGETPRRLGLPMTSMPTHGIEGSGKLGAIVIGEAVGEHHDFVEDRPR